jgi:hypothetical protein
MKRTVLTLLVIGAVLVMSSPASAKWRLMVRTPKGNWYASDKVVKVQGDCKTILMLFFLKKPVMSRVLKKMIVARKYLVRFCCQAKTYQTLGFILVDSRKKDVLRRKVKVPPKPIRPGTVVATIARRVCSPGFGARVPAPGVKAPPPAGVKAPAAPAAPAVKKPAAADSYKQTCKFCSNSGGIWLCCTCKTNSGANKRSCLDPRKCAGRGISNCDGVLTCGPCK